jgi:RNA polymerase sigma-70 factor (sigma-E family)
VGLKPRSRWQHDPREEPEFERFVTACATSLLRSAYLLTGDSSAAEDLLQVALLRTAHRWRSAQEAPEAYARRVLLNLVRDRWRQSARRVAERPMAEATRSGRDLLCNDHAEAFAGREEVFGALARLPAEQREVLVLRFYADLSVAETAAATGTSQGTVKSRTSRALARMRELLADPFPPSAQPIPDEVAHDD